MTEPSPITILNRALKTDRAALLSLLQEYADSHRSFVGQTTNKAAALAALDLEAACREIIQHLEQDDLLAICHEVRLSVPALHAARHILETTHA